MRAKNSPGSTLYFVEFEGFGHEIGGDEALLAERVIPVVVDWAEGKLGASW